jgi:hypothetical protein
VCIFIVLGMVGEMQSDELALGEFGATRGGAWYGKGQLGKTTKLGTGSTLDQVGFLVLTFDLEESILPNL